MQKIKASLKMFRLHTVIGTGVKDFINASLVRRKGATVKTVDLPEKESLPDVLGRSIRNKREVEIFNLKTQEDVVMASPRSFKSCRKSLSARLAAS